MNKKVENRAYWSGIGISAILVLAAGVSFLKLNLVGRAMLLVLIALGLMLLLLIWSMVKREMARISLILGMIGALLAVVMIGLLCSVLAIVFGINSLRRKKRIGVSRAGIILGAIGIAYFLYIIIASLIELH